MNTTAPDRYSVYSRWAAQHAEDRTLTVEREVADMAWRRLQAQAEDLRARGAKGIAMSCNSQQVEYLQLSRGEDVGVDAHVLQVASAPDSRSVFEVCALVPKPGGRIGTLSQSKRLAVTRTSARALAHRAMECLAQRREELRQQGARRLLLLQDDEVQAYWGLEDGADSGWVHDRWPAAAVRTDWNCLERARYANQHAPTHVFVAWPGSAATHHTFTYNEELVEAAWAELLAMRRALAAEGALRLEIRRGQLQLACQDLGAHDVPIVRRSADFVRAAHESRLWMPWWQPEITAADDPRTWFETQVEAVANRATSWARSDARLLMQGE